MLDVLERNVGVLKKTFSKLPTGESALVSRVFGGISKKKTYEILTWLDRSGHVLPYLGIYLRYSEFSISDITKELQKGETQFALIELLIMTHLIHASTGDRAFDFEKFFAVTTSAHVEIPEPAVSDYEWFASVIESVQVHGRTVPLEHYVESLIIPSGPYAGSHYRHFRFSPGRQLYRWASPEDDTTVISHMWSIQLGKSTFAENVVIYYMKVTPAEIMHAFATGDAAEKCAKKRITPRAQQEGVKFIARDWGGEQDTKARVSGNKILSKEFFGGNYDAVTVGSTSQTASESKRIVIKEEIDRDGWDKGGGKEGDQDTVIDARATSWGGRKKIINVSSPNLLETSRIYKKFLDGTQHRYYVVAPCCGGKYHLEFGFTESHGLQYSVVDGSVDVNSIYYRCPVCNGKWFENQKEEAMDDRKGAEWVAHAKPVFENHVSTHLNQLYSVVAKWKDVCEAHYKVVLDPSTENVFWNAVLGLPYEPKGSRPEPSKMLELRDYTYSTGEVPTDVLYLTAAVDVQRGSANLQKKNPARLEIEILGHCENFVTKSIDYLQVLGETDTAGAGAWKSLDELFDNNTFMFTTQDGVKMAPVIWFVDAHDGLRTEQVYQWCRQRGSRVYPIMGMGKTEFNIGNDDEKKTDKNGASDFRRYKRVKVEEDLIVYQIATRYYKGRLYDSINSTIARCGEIEPFPSKVHFPADYPDSYFDMLTAEERHKDGTFTAPKGRRNEALDCRVYNLAAADAWIQDLIQHLRGVARKALVAEEEIKKIDFRSAVEFLKKAKMREVGKQENEKRGIRE